MLRKFLLSGLAACALADGHKDHDGNELIGINWELSNTDMQCGIDGATTYKFEINQGHVRDVHVEQQGNDCKFVNGTSALSKSGNTYTLNIPATCFKHAEDGESHSASIQIFASASANHHLYQGQINQDLTCNMKREHSVSFNFTTITLDQEQEGELTDGGEVGYEITRRYSNWDLNTSTNVTSGEKVYFKVESKGDYTDFDFDLVACSVSKSTDTYFLFDFHKKHNQDHLDANTCIEPHLKTGITKYRSYGYIYFWYEAFTFKTEDQTDVIVTCDIVACLNSESAVTYECPGWKCDSLP